MQRAGRQKTASGMTVYLMEELGDARLNCAQLTHYIDLARQIVEKSPQRDHIFEVAGHLLQAIPEHLFKLEKSLQAVALAADRLDYEEIKQDLKPDKVQELERVLNDVRIRTVPHRSEPQRPTMNPMQAAEELQKIATEIRTTGKVPTQSVLSLVAALEGQERTASEVSSTADMFDEMGKALMKPSSESPKRLHLAATLRKVIADNLTAGTDFGSIREAWNAGVKEATQSTNQDQLSREIDPTLHIAEKDVKENMDALQRFRPSGLGGPWGILSKMQDGLWGFVYWSAVKNALANPKTASGLPISPEEQEARRSRFEKGQPADPTENMSPEDKQNWKQKNDEHKDNFKEAIERGPAQFLAFLDRMVGGVEEAAKQMRHSLNVYQQDTGKNAPQLGNFFREVASLQGQMRVLERAMPKNIVFANQTPTDWKVAKLHK